MPADVNLVPVVFDAPQVALAHLAQIAQRRRVADERDDLFLRWGRDFDGGKNYLQILRNDALELQKTGLVILPEFFGAGDVDEVVRCV